MVECYLLTGDQRVIVEPGPYRTEDTIVKESVLINVYRNTYLTLEKNLVLNHLTTHHTEPDMTATYAALRAHMHTSRPHVFQPGRRTAYEIPDMFNKGLMAFAGASTNNPDDEGGTGEEEEDATVDGEDDDDERAPDIDDLNVELDF